MALDNSEKKFRRQKGAQIHTLLTPEFTKVILDRISHKYVVVQAILLDMTITKVLMDSSGTLIIGKYNFKSQKKKEANSSNHNGRILMEEQRFHPGIKIYVL